MAQDESQRPTWNKLLSSLSGIAEPRPHNDSPLVVRLTTPERKGIIFAALGLPLPDEDMKDTWPNGIHGLGGYVNLSERPVTVSLFKRSFAPQDIAPPSTNSGTL